MSNFDTTKTYAAKSSVTRALKAAGLDPEQFNIVEEDGKFRGQPKQTAKKASKKVDPRTLTACPKCGSEEIYHGRNDKGLVVDEDLVGGCHHCDWEFDLRQKQPRNGNCRKVWDMADSMPGAARKDVVSACVEAGINLGTAKTQYQAWFASKRG